MDTRPRFWFYLTMDNQAIDLTLSTRPRNDKCRRVKCPVRYPTSIAPLLLCLMLAGTSIVRSQIGYELLPNSIKKALEISVPAVRWRDASPKESLDDVIEKLNMALPAEQRLKISPFEFKPRRETDSNPRYAEPLFPLLYPENTVTFSGRECKARELIRLVCDTTGFAVSAWGENQIVFRQVDSDLGLEEFTERISIPLTARQDLERWTDYSWLKEEPWKTRFLLRAMLPLESRVKWSNRDTTLTVKAGTFAIWRIQSLARSAPFPDSSGQLSAADRKLGRSLLPLFDLPANLTLPDSSLPLGKFVEQVEKILAGRGLKLDIRVPATLVAQTPEPLLGPEQLVPDIPGLDGDNPDFTSRLWNALSDYGVQMKAIEEAELIIAPRSVRDNLDDTMTTEFRVSRDFLDKVPPAKPAPDAPSPPDAIIEPGIRFPRGSMVIFSKSTSTLTVRAPRWRYFSILALVEQIEKGEFVRKSKLKK